MNLSSVLDCSLRPIVGARSVAVVSSLSVVEGANLGNGGESRNPGKRGKIASVAFYPASFLAKTCALVMQRDDAPSMALLVLQDKMPRSLTGHGVPGTVKIGLPSKFQK